ncbi:MAG: enoyl-CoA hydratase/isomerase family protein [Salinirussus sp.]
MDADLLDHDTADGHHHVALSNPDKPNPINGQLQDELHAVLDAVEADDEARVLTVTGADGSFAVGADISQMHDWFEARDWQALLTFFRAGQELMNRIASLDTVTVAGVNGYALGGGLELALACDIRIAAESATVGFPEVDLGMVPGWGGTQRLPEVAGESTAKDLLVTGRHVDATEAHTLGIVDRVVDGGELETELFEYAETLAEKPDHVLPYLLDAVETGAAGGMDTRLSYEFLSNVFASFEDETADLVAEFAEQ